ncbi:MAG: oxidoreductase, partial [Pseudomonadota bacterium]
AAGRIAEAGLDGVEILCGFGYLISQFLNPHTNQREDEFGGSREHRSRFLKEILQRCRNRLGTEKTLGIRISISELTSSSIAPEEMLEICQSIDNEGLVDYFSVISGSSAAPEGWIKVFPPMAIEPGFVSADSAKLKKTVKAPVLVTGRINQPQIAEQILSDGHADMIGMARGLIADPELPKKARAGLTDDIRACVGCNQACVGHRLAHFPVSCIQHPVTGRELELGTITPAKAPLNVMIVGGG